MNKYGYNFDDVTKNGCSIDLPKIKVFRNKGWHHNLHPCHQQNFIRWLKLFCRFGHVTKVWQLKHFYFISIWTEKPLLLRGGPGLSSIIWDWHQCSKNFYTSVAKALKLKVREFFRLIPTFIEVTQEKLVGKGELFAPTPPYFEYRLNIRQC